ncbi:YjbF family lipoprotein [Mesobacterium pallidum]|uniref:YjbF family lipoprotein n=1 Tax=Mesobacterium pallidum TaxID=2872037 RepID=UPI001EE21809|nr:YjbF family lipoprotein [Mesobacterium pallidum]
MKRPLVTRAIAPLALAAALAACGNDDSARQSTAVLRNVAGLITGGGGAAAPAAPTGEQVAQTLANTDQPVALVNLEASQLTALLIRIEQNGRYDTYGSSDRRTVTFKDGMITASRGLGGDLMSASLDGSLALVSARRAGSAVRQMRFLDGEDQIFAYEFTCTVTDNGTQPMPGSGKPTRKMTESCGGDLRSFENSYYLDGAGDIVASRQWMGPVLGYVNVAQARK